MMSLTRRGLITGLAAAFAAPAIVRIDNIMPVKNLIVPTYTFSCFVKAAEGKLLPSAEGVLTPVGNGWYRWETSFQASNGQVHLRLPKDMCWGAQVVDLSLHGPSGNGVLILPGVSPREV